MISGAFCPELCSSTGVQTLVLRKVLEGKIGKRMEIHGNTMKEMIDMHSFHTCSESSSNKRGCEVGKQCYPAGCHFDQRM